MKDFIKDLWILITSDLCWSSHCNMITSKAYKQLGPIRCSFTTNYVSVKNSSISPGVRSQLLYCLQVWRPCMHFSGYTTPWKSTTESYKIIIFLTTIHHLITPDFLNSQCSLLCTFLSWMIYYSLLNQLIIRHDILMLQIGSIYLQYYSGSIYHLYIMQ